MYVFFKEKLGFYIFKICNDKNKILPMEITWQKFALK